MRVTSAVWPVVLRRYMILAVAAIAAIAFCCSLDRFKSVETWASGPKTEQILGIGETFMRVLDRRPTPRELATVRGRLRDDPTYSLNVLETQLELSDERKRRVATQTNALSTELEGIYSRQQVRLHVRNVYADHVGATPSADTEYFLLQKYVQSGLNEHELIRLVKAISIVPLAGNPSPNDSSGEDNGTTFSTLTGPGDDARA